MLTSRSVPARQRKELHYEGPPGVRCHVRARAAIPRTVRVNTRKGHLHNLTAALFFFVGLGSKPGEGIA